MPRLLTSSTHTVSFVPFFRRRPRLADPVDGGDQLRVAKQPELRRHGKTHRGGGDPQPRHVGDQSHAVPSTEMAKAQHDVIPHGARVEPGEVWPQVIEQPQFAIHRECGLDIRHQHTLIVFGRHLPTGTKTQCTRGETLHLLDHGPLLDCCWHVSQTKRYVYVDTASYRTASASP